MAKNNVNYITLMKILLQKNDDGDEKNFMAHRHGRRKLNFLGEAINFRMGLHFFPFLPPHSSPPLVIVYGLRIKFLPN
jgi:hypothetical protein